MRSGAEGATIEQVTNQVLGCHAMTEIYALVRSVSHHDQTEGVLPNRSIGSTTVYVRDTSARGGRLRSLQANLLWLVHSPSSGSCQACLPCVES